VSRYAPGMEPDRFDDVETRILESPEPPPRRWRGRWRKRWTVAAVVALFAAGGVTAGASALSGSDDPAPRKAASEPGGHMGFTADGVPTERSGHECRFKDGKRGMGEHRGGDSGGGTTGGSAADL
jgi:hypothetical protein